MRMFRCLRSFALGVALALFSGLGFASSVTDVAYAVRMAGDYGHASAKYEVQRTFMAGKSVQRVTRSAGLVKHSHGFLQVTADASPKALVGSTVHLIG